jgi:hypothetical protein
VRLYYYGRRISYLSWYPNIYKFEILEGDMADAPKTSLVKFVLESIPDHLIITGRVVCRGESELKTVLVFVDKTWLEVRREIGDEKYDEVIISQINTSR